MTHYRLGN